MDEGQVRAWLKLSKVFSLLVSTLPSDPAPLQESLEFICLLAFGPSEYRKVGDRKGSSGWLTGRMRSALSLSPLSET